MIFTIGHSTRPIDEFIDLFDRAGLAGIHYTHMPGLGGLRRPRKDSIKRNAWR